MKQTLLTVEEKELLAKAARLMEELIETVRITDDEELVRDINDALKEAKEGKLRSLDSLIKELNLENEVQA